MAHKTLINGTSYDIKSGKTLIGGTGYDVKKGRTLIGGTGYDIPFGKKIAELAEGTIIKINESGSPVEFYVAKHNTFIYLIHLPIRFTPVVVRPHTIIKTHILHLPFSV